MQESKPQGTLPTLDRDTNVPNGTAAGSNSRELEALSAKALFELDRAAENFKRGIVSPPADLSDV